MLGEKISGHKNTTAIRKTNHFDHKHIILNSHTLTKVVATRAVCILPLFKKSLNVGRYKLHYTPALNLDSMFIFFTVYTFSALHKVPGIGIKIKTNK